MKKARFKVVDQNYKPKLADHVMVQLPDIILSLRLMDCMQWAEQAANIADASGRPELARRLVSACGVFKDMNDVITKEYADGTVKTDATREDKQVGDPEPIAVGVSDAKSNT